MAVRVWVYGPVLAGATAASMVLGAVGGAASIALFGVGVLAWTILEYLMHRFAFHGFAPHYLHHADPGDPRHILAPLWLWLSGGGGLWALLWAVTGSGSKAGLIVAGVIAGYLGYEMVHLRIHGRRPGGAVLRALRRHHFHHHFADDQVCYGVTSPVWDFLFDSLKADR